MYNVVYSTLYYYFTVVGNVLLCVIYQLNFIVSMPHMVGHPRCVFISYIGLINCRTQLICGRHMFII